MTKRNTPDKGTSTGDDTYDFDPGDFNFYISDAYIENNDDDESAYVEESDSTVEEPMSSTQGASTHVRPKRSNAGGGVARLEPSLYGKEYVEFNNKKTSALAQVLLVKKLVQAILLQMSAKKGFKKYGERAVASMFKELK